jgi:hypothetical protein
VRRLQSPLHAPVTASGPRQNSALLIARALWRQATIVGESLSWPLLPGERRVRAEPGGLFSLS